MNFITDFKSFCFKAVVALVAAGAIVGTESAEAATIAAGSKLNLSDPVRGGVSFLTAPTPTLDFFGTPALGGVQNVGVSESTGSFLGATSLPLPLAQIKDLNLNFIGGDLYQITGPVPDFIRGIDIGGILTGPPGGNDVTFELTDFVFNKQTGDSTVFKGIFRSGSFSIGGVGRFTSQTDLGNPSSYSLSIVAVPTPALLPGLIALGAGVVRKRKVASLEKAEA